jgi:UbiD family decarboxylase
MDLRSFIRSLSERGLLQRVTEEVDVILQLGEIARERRKPLLFENLKGYPGFSVFTNGLSSPAAIAAALDLPPTVSRADLAREIAIRASLLIAPAVVTNGPVLQNVETSDVDLSRLPVPHWHPQDCGPYLGTWHINVTRDPESGERNVGVYRMQLLGPKHATVSTSPRSHLARHFAKAESSNQSLPMAVAIGVSETTMMAAAAATPQGVDEFALAGAFSKQPLRLVKCRTIDLEVPADAEIVIEGLIRCKARAVDGPYMDYAGVPSVNPLAFVFEATAILHRDDPIFRGTSIGQPGAEDHQLFAALADLSLVDFHNRRFKQRLQSFLLRRRMFEAFQFTGRMNNPLR